MTEPSSNPAATHERRAGYPLAARHRVTPRPLHDLLGTALAGACRRRYRRRSIPRGVVARLWLWLPPLARAIGWRFSVLALLRACPVRRVALADGGRRVAPARPRQRRTASAGDRHRRQTRGDAGRRSLARTLAGACRAHVASRARFQARLAIAARGVARSLRAARVSSWSGDRHFHRRRRRALEAHRCGVRLAGRGAAGEFPRRCLGDAAGLYRPAAGGSGRHPSGRDHAADRIRRTRCGAGRLDLGGARTGKLNLEISSKGGVTPSKDGPQAPAGTQEFRYKIAGHRHGDGARSGRRPDLGVQRHSRQAADDCDDQGSRAAGARFAAVDYRMEDDYGVTDAQATFARKETRGRTAPRRIRCSARRISRWCCRKRAPKTASARPSRISPIILGPAPK